MGKERRERYELLGEEAEPKHKREPKTFFSFTDHCLLF